MPTATTVALMAMDVTVLDFKAIVDELSRISAARGEDENMVLQLQEKQAGMEVDDVDRLVQECVYREEWRKQRCEKALRELPVIALKDAERFDSMRDYVALLAPRPDMIDEGALPWQHELTKQQQALANILQLCPSGSPERIHQTLASFMQHSEARLHEQLSAARGRAGVRAAADGARRGGDDAARSPSGPAHEEKPAAMSSEARHVTRTMLRRIGPSCCVAPVHRASFCRS
jgi:hypothetical protein